MALQNSDLLYVDQGGSGTLYQVTWERINTRQVNPADELLVQRGSDRLPSSNRRLLEWTRTLSQPNDYYLVERNSHAISCVEILFPAAYSNSTQ